MGDQMDQIPIGSDDLSNQALQLTAGAAGRS
jgi:hypothetical protein